MTAGMTMTEYRMPDPPEGYDWRICPRDWRDLGWAIWVYLDGKSKSYSNYCVVKSIKDEECNARVAIAVANSILEFFHNPPPPKPQPSFNGLTGYRRG